MSGELFSQFTMVLAVFFSGCAIKMLDDFMDHDLDRIAGQSNLYERLGDGLPAYMALALVMATYLAPVISVTLFLSAYATGMAQQLGARYWGGWPAWLETVLAVGLGLIISPRRFMLSLALMVILQLADDLHDLPRDRYLGYRTVAARLGKWVSRIVVVLGSGALLCIAPLYSTTVLGVAWVIARGAEGVSGGDLAIDTSQPDRFGRRL